MSPQMKVSDQVRGAVAPFPPTAMIALPRDVILAICDVLDDLAGTRALPAGGPLQMGLDISVKQMAELEDKGTTTIRDRCAAGYYPGTIEKGVLVPGAYKNSSGDWRITLAGIHAAQEREREEAVDRQPMSQASPPALREGTVRRANARPPGDEPHPAEYPSGPITARIQAADPASLGSVAATRPRLRGRRSTKPDSNSPVPAEPVGERKRRAWRDRRGVR